MSPGLVFIALMVICLIGLHCMCSPIDRYWISDIGAIWE